MLSIFATSWGWMVNYDAAPSLDEYAAMEAADSNVWWRLDCGHHLNLFEEAVDRLEAVEAENARLREALDKAYAAIGQTLREAEVPAFYGPGSYWNALVEACDVVGPLLAEGAGSY